MLSFAGLVPIRQLGVLGATAITFALLPALFVEPGALYLWARRHQDARARPRTRHLGGGGRGPHLVSAADVARRENELRQATGGMGGNEVLRTAAQELEATCTPTARPPGASG